MWNNKCQMRNQFLHMCLPKSKPQANNEILCSEIHQISEVIYHAHIIRSIKPVKSKILGFDGTTLAYGNWALPKIIQKICSKDCGIQIFAMNKLCELIINEFEARRAILEFDIVKSGFFFSSCKCDTDNALYSFNDVNINSICKNIYDLVRLVQIMLSDILANCLLAALQMCDRPNLINELYILSVRGEHRQICSGILRTLTQHPKVIDFFVNETNWFKVLSKILKDNFIALMDLNLLEHFSHFLQLKPQMAIEEGFFNLILQEIAEKQASQQVLLKCFALLLNCREGQEMLDDCDGITVLYKILMDEQLTTYQYIAQVFQNASSSSRVSLWKCKELWDLPHGLIKRAHNRYNDKQQLYCLQTLRQITTMPSVKQYVRKVCIPQIRNIEAHNENVKKMKEKLLIWLMSDVYKREETVGE